MDNDQMEMPMTKQRGILTVTLPMLRTMLGVPKGHEIRFAAERRRKDGEFVIELGIEGPMMPTIQLGEIVPHVEVCIRKGVYGETLWAGVKEVERWDEL